MNFIPYLESMTVRYTRQMKQQMSEVIDIQSVLLQLEELKNEVGNFIYSAIIIFNLL